MSLYHSQTGGGTISSSGVPNRQAFEGTCVWVVMVVCVASVLFGEAVLSGRRLSCTESQGEEMKGKSGPYTHTHCSSKPASLCDRCNNVNDGKDYNVQSILQSMMCVFQRALKNFYIFISFCPPCIHTSQSGYVDICVSVNVCVRVCVSVYSLQIAARLWFIHPRG